MHKRCQERNKVKHWYPSHHQLPLRLQVYSLTPPPPPNYNGVVCRCRVSLIPIVGCTWVLGMWTTVWTKSRQAETNGRIDLLGRMLSPLVCHAILIAFKGHTGGYWHVEYVHQSDRLGAMLLQTVTKASDVKGENRCLLDIAAPSYIKRFDKNMQ